MGELIGQLILVTESQSTLHLASPKESRLTVQLKRNKDKAQLHENIWALLLHS